MNKKPALIQQLDGERNDHEQNECTNWINLQYMDKTGSTDENLKYVDVHNRIFAFPSELKWLIFSAPAFVVNCVA